MHIPNNAIHNSQKVETAHTSTNGWLDKQIVIYTHNRLCSYKKKWSPDTSYMNLKNIMLGERSQAQKGHILYDSIYMRNPEKVNP